MSTIKVSLDINGKTYGGTVQPRMLLSDFIREQADLTGTHVGCEQGVCGACTVQLDGVPVRSCLMFAVQAEGHELRTVEGMQAEDGSLHPLQQAFQERHALQCGFCTPGFLMTLEPMLGRVGEMDGDELRDALGGNICRCTGYQGIVEATRLAAARLGGDDPSEADLDRPAAETKD